MVKVGTLPFYKVDLFRWCLSNEYIKIFLIIVVASFIAIFKTYIYMKK